MCESPQKINWQGQSWFVHKILPAPHLAIFGGGVDAVPLANLAKELSPREFPVPLANPIGLNLGGELPECIALSILAEIQAVLHQRSGLSYSLSLISSGAN